jgi:hypothetical protein
MILTNTGQVEFIEHELFVMPIDEAQDSPGDARNNEGLAPVDR